MSLEPGWFTNSGRFKQIELLRICMKNLKNEEEKGG